MYLFFVCIIWFDTIEKNLQQHVKRRLVQKSYQTNTFFQSLSLCSCLNFLLQQVLHRFFLMNIWQIKKQPAMHTHLFLLHQPRNRGLTLDAQLWQARLVAAATLESHHLGKTEFHFRFIIEYESISHGVGVAFRQIVKQYSQGKTNNFIRENHWSHYQYDVYVHWHRTHETNLQNMNMKTGVM